MMRFALSAFIAFALAVLPLSAQQTPLLSVDLSTLGLGPISAIHPIELDGRPGSEFLVKLWPPFTTDWRAVYPQSPTGLCASPVFTVLGFDDFVDLNADGRQEILRFDVSTQTAVFIAIPQC